MNKKQRYHQMLNETMNREQLIYLTVQCSTRSKKIASKAKRLLDEGNHAEALRIADPIGYEVGLREYNF